MNASTSTFEGGARVKKSRLGSEQLDRIATVSHLAEEVFESEENAAHWMSMPNKALGGSAPIMLCEAEIGAKQVRRVLQALEWGSAT
jgi:putative toxin-antitoxin system antitoxin component (TIGR02293 family)